MEHFDVPKDACFEDGRQCGLSLICHGSIVSTEVVDFALVAYNKSHSKNRMRYGLLQKFMVLCRVDLHEQGLQTTVDIMISQASSVVVSFPSRCVPLHGVFGSPFSSRTVVSSPVCFEELGDIWHQRIVGVGVGKKAADGKQDLADGQCGTPLILQNVQTNSSIRVDVAMVNASGEVNLGWFERIVRWEMNIEEENAAGIWGIIGTHDGCLPMEHVVSNWSSGTVGWRILSQIDKFYQNAR
jgi:hypothetical protein